VREVEAESVVEPQVPQAAEQAVIRHRNEDDARDQNFWKRLVQSDPEKALVKKETAIFAIRTILVELMGFKAHRTAIDFKTDPVSLGDLFSLLEKLSGQNGWQKIQRKAGF
jgi:hypothetical protein